MPTRRLFGRESGTHSGAITIRRELRRKNPRHRNTKGNSMKHLFVRLIQEEQGQDLVEYALIVAAVGLALITTVNQLSQGIVSLYQSITGDLSSIGAQQ